MIKELLKFLLFGFLFAGASVAAALVLYFELGGLLEIGGIFFIAGNINCYLEGKI